MTLVLSGLPVLALACLSLAVGVVGGIRPLLIRSSATIADRVLWSLGAVIVVGAAFLTTALRPGRSTARSLDAAEVDGVVEATMRALGDGRLDRHQVDTEPVFLTAPTILRTAGSFGRWAPDSSGIARMVDAGLLDGHCDATDLVSCPVVPDAVYVGFTHRPSGLTDHVSVQLEVARPRGPGCRSASDSVDATTFRVRVVEGAEGWSVRRVVTVGGGPKGCAAG